VHVSERDAGSQARVPMLPLSSSLGMGEYERLQLQFARTGGTYTAALANAIYNDAANLTNEVLNRLELADRRRAHRRQADHERARRAGRGGGLRRPRQPAHHAGHRLDRHHELHPAQRPDRRRGRLPGGGQRRGRLLPQLAEVHPPAVPEQGVHQRVQGLGRGVSRITPAEVNDVLAANDLPTLLPSFDESLDVDGTSTRVIADNKFIRLPENPEDLLKVRMGVSATALELVNSKKAELSFEDAPASSASSRRPTACRTASSPTSTRSACRTSRSPVG
jgi:hypothetical protein